MRALFWVGLVSTTFACGGAPPSALPVSSGAPAAHEPTVSNVIRTRLPKATDCGTDDVCGFYLQVISPGSEPEQLTKHALETLRGHCGGAIIVYRDKRGVMGSGAVFATAEEKQACREAIGRTADLDDYPSAAVWRKAD